MTLLSSLIATIFLTISAYSHASDLRNKKSPNLPPALVIYPAAKEIETHTERDGKASVIYWVEQRYPAEKVLGYVKDSLVAQHWKLLMNDWLNPEIPSSHVRGWTKWVDGTVTPNRRVHQWIADWQNEQGDIVFFEFRYDSRFDPSRRIDKPPDNPRVRVTGVYYPREIAQKIRQATKTFQHER